jgi:hypothetical protein
MRHYRPALIVLSLLLAGSAAAQDETANEVNKILERATEALGGADTLAKYRGMSWRGKGSFKLADIALVFDGDAFAQDYDRFRQELALGENQTASLTMVVSATKGWIKVGDKTMPLPQQLETLRHDFYALALAQRPHLLRDKRFAVSLVGEVEVMNRPALGIRVAQKGWPEVNLCYDKESGLPVKAEVRVKDPTSAQEVSDEFFFSAYQSTQGRQHYTKMIGKRNGNDYLERELTDVRWHEELPSSLFEMP